jgi:hemerythrin
MALIDWREDLMTGDAVIDSQHRTLCKMLSELHEALLTKRSKEITNSILDALERYVAYHFNVERQLMEATAYPSMRAHLKLHEDIVSRTRETIESYRSNGLAIGVTVTQALARTLVEHIYNEDKKLVQWSRLNGGQAATSGLFPTNASVKQVAEPAAVPDRESSTQRTTSSANWAARDSLRQIVAAVDARNKK